MFQVSAFARLAGVSAKVLRDYDDARLFRPAWVDRQTGYRLYSPAQLPEVRRILALRDLGVSLADIRALLVDGADLQHVLDEHRRALEAARRETDRRLAALGISLAAGEQGPDVVVRDVPSELAATLDVAEVGGDVERAFYELELRVRDVGVRAARPPGALMRESAESHHPAEPEVEVFVPVRRPAAGLAVRRLPPVRAATVLHHGPYETLLRTRAVLDEWIAAAALAPGEPVRLLYLQFGAEDDLRLPRQYLVERGADLLTEIQVPIEP